MDQSQISCWTLPCHLTVMICGAVDQTKDNKGRNEINEVSGPMNDNDKVNILPSSVNPDYRRNLR